MTSDIEREVRSWPWVISTMESDMAEFVIQSNTVFYGAPEMKDVQDAGLVARAISSHGANGQLRLHVEER